MRVLGIDPGETTGWAISNITTGGTHKVQSFGEINCEDLLTSGFEVEEPQSKYAKYRAVALALMQVMVEEQALVVIIEDFTLRQMTTTKAEGISPVRIGMALEVWINDIMLSGEWDRQECRHPPVVWQTASQIGVMTKARMEAANLWQSGFPHACDAIRHNEIYRRTWTTKQAAFKK